MRHQQIINLQVVIRDYYKIERLSGFSAELMAEIRELEAKLAELLSD